MRLIFLGITLLGISCLPALERPKSSDSEPNSDTPEEPSNESNAEPAAEPSSEPSLEPSSEPSSQPSSEPSSEPSSDCNSNMMDTLNEQEPNDFQTESDVHEIQSNRDIRISGSLTCGNDEGAYNADNDVFKINTSCAGSATLKLDWSTSSDLDFYVYTSDFSAGLESNAQEGMSGPIVINTSLNAGGFSLHAVCWEGETADYEITIDWD